MSRVAPEIAEPDEPIREVQNVTIPTYDQSTDRGGASTPDSTSRTAWPPNEAPPPYCEQPGDQDQFSERSFEPPPPYDSAANSTNGESPICDRLGVQPETTSRGAHPPTTSHHSEHFGGVSTSCLVVWCIFCPFVFIICLTIFAVAVCVSTCAEKCCGHAECASNCRRKWESFCP